MSNLVYPYQIDWRSLAYTVTRTVANDTIIQSSRSKVENRIFMQSNPIWKYILVYEVLKDIPTDILPTLMYTDLQTLQGFVIAMRCAYDSFLFDDPDDDTVGPALLPNGAPNLQAQLQIFQDITTGNWYSPVQINRGGYFYEDVTDLNGSIGVFSNGIITVQGTDYSIGGPGLAITTVTGGMSFAGLYLLWTGAESLIGPSPPVTAQFNFYHRLRFDMDSVDFEKFVNQMWTIGGSESKNGSGQLKLISARTTSV